MMKHLRQFRVPSLVESCILLSALLDTCVSGLPAPRSSDNFPAGHLAARDTTSTGYRSVAYFGNWDIYARGFSPRDVPAKLLTHVIYGFFQTDKATGNVSLSDSYADVEKMFPGESWADSATGDVHGEIKQFYLLKQQNRNMKVMMSIGGWTYTSDDASNTQQGKGHQFDGFVASGSIMTDTTIRRFADSSTQLLEDCGFDGIDLDWEYPRDDLEANAYVVLLKSIREKLDKYAESVPGRPHFLLSVAAPAGPQHYKKMNLTGMDPYVDMWNLMAYDYAGSFSNISGHASNLYCSTSNPESTPFNTMDAVRYYKGQGIDPSKINLGMPLYGRSFLQTAGPGESFQGVSPADPSNGSWEAGTIDYKNLSITGPTVYFDKDIGASWSYDNVTQEMISYDTPEVVDLKIKFIQDNELGGAAWWEASSDRPASGDGSLINQVWQTLGGADGAAMEHVNNTLCYKKSSYTNIRNGTNDTAHSTAPVC